MNQGDCVFCKMIEGRIPIVRVYEDDVVLAFLDIGPLSDGHTLVIPKQHFDMVHNCPDDVLASLWKRMGKIAAAVVVAMDAEGYNILCNNGRSAGQVVEHLHFHIIPRNSGDGVFDRWPTYNYSEGKIERIAAKICEKL